MQIYSLAVQPLRCLDRVFVRVYRYCGGSWVDRSQHGDGLPQFLHAHKEKALL